MHILDNCVTILFLVSASSPDPETGSKISSAVPVDMGNVSWFSCNSKL